MDTPQLNTMQVEWWPIDKVVPYDRNPRVLSEKAIQKVAGSLRAFGWRQPLVVDKDGVLIVGHTRREAAKLLNQTTVPVHVAADMSEDDARRYRIADNRVAEETDWDEALLTLELGELGAAGLDLVALGFDDKELAAMLSAGPPSLEQLEAEHGDGAGGEAAFWATLKIKVSPETKRKYEQLLLLVSGDSEDEQFANIIDAATRGYDATA